VILAYEVRGIVRVLDEIGIFDVAVDEALLFHRSELLFPIEEVLLDLLPLFVSTTDNQVNTDCYENEKKNESESLNDVRYSKSSSWLVVGRLSSPFQNSLTCVPISKRCRPL